MASPGERLASSVAAVRRRSRLVDHLVRMQEHYGAVKAGRQAGAVTYFGFLSFFPILALTFFVVGLVSRVYAGARQDLTDALNTVMPGLIGSDEGQATLDQIERAASTLGIIGAVVLLYTGLGWLSAMRDALTTVFETPEDRRPGFVAAKLRDLLVLVLIGGVLFVSVALAGLIGGFSGDLADWLHLGVDLGWVVRVLTILVGVAADLLLFFLCFRLLGRTEAPRSALWQGALLGALAFEVLKQLSNLLLQSTQGNPAFQAFGIALIILVWINYFSRIVLYAAAFAHTAPAARAARVAEPAAPVEGPPSPPVVVDAGTPAWVAPYAAGALSTLGLVALARRITRTDR
ncbi:MAG: YihY/virulence factor BrkB family protein [Nocardioides sp.]|nr:YihY/virulence factor BrkB family protein [Nocardioidaceae bacterium]MCB8956473.1 YihY/virulence factor BrkB family protein [Nocardioides sp.]